MIISREDFISEISSSYPYKSNEWKAFFSCFELLAGFIYDYIEQVSLAYDSNTTSLESIEAFSWLFGSLEKQEVLTRIKAQHSQASAVKLLNLLIPKSWVDECGERVYGVEWMRRGDGTQIADGQGFFKRAHYNSNSIFSTYLEERGNSLSFENNPQAYLIYADYADPQFPTVEHIESINECVTPRRKNEK